jgi:3-dehydroquinate synthase
MASKRLAKVEYAKTLPNAHKFQKSLAAQKIVLIYDEKLLLFPVLKKWIQSFSDSCPVTAGEDLKTLSSLQIHAPKILRQIQGSSRQKVVIVALGGGSVGDFAGFVASVLKRGVRLVHIPSTWLAAIDSAHGGKTALNLGEFKNQLGTFKEAERIVIIREILSLQNDEAVRSAMGELIKMALLAGGSLFSKLEKLTSPTLEKIWPLLRLAVEAKYKVVRRDPFEEKGIRYILNLGHTLGHAYELSAGLSHGVAVCEGTKFALQFSETQKLLGAKDLARAQKLLRSLGPVAKTPTLRRAQLRDLLLQDKKATGGDRLRFVMLKKPGKAVVKDILVDDVVAEAIRQGVAQ